MGGNAMIKCPKCGSTNVTCMDGAGAISKYGRDVMIDIAFDMWLCGDCGESFRLDEFLKRIQKRRTAINENSDDDRKMGRRC